MENALFIERLNNTNIINLELNEYLKASIDSEQELGNLCIGWEYMKLYLTPELKEIINPDNKNYWDLPYNDDKREYILNQLYTTEEINKLTNEIIKQCGSFVYVWNCIKRDCEKEQEATELKEKLTVEGFKEQDIFNDEELKLLNNKKVVCVMDVSAIGVLGSFDKKRELKGTLVWSDYRKGLMLIPTRCRTRGYIVKNTFYYKEVV